MASIAGAAVLVIAEVMRGTRESVSRDGQSYDGQEIPWTTMFAAGLAAALYAPLLAGAFMALPLVSEFSDPDFAIVGAVLFALIAGLFGLAVTLITIGLAVGSAIVVNRPNAWWFARAWAGLGLVLGWYVWDPFGSLIDEARIMGWAMLGMALVLLALVLPPRGKPRPVPPRRRRFVL